MSKHLRTGMVTQVSHKNTKENTMHTQNIHTNMRRGTAHAPSTLQHHKVIEFIEAHRKQVPLQYELYAGAWYDIDPDNLHDLLSHLQMCPTRIKPETTTVPWTADAWKVFSAETVVETATGKHWDVSSWSATDVKLSDRDCGMEVVYERLLAEFTLRDGRPCGRIIENNKELI